MNNLSYLQFKHINPSEFLPLLNSQKIRKHLVEHPLFTIDSLKVWMKKKIEMDATFGCKIRAIIYDDTLVGWCGIQLEEGKYEVAIIIDDQYWGLGKQVFRHMMTWAKEFRHRKIYIHFLHTRPEYKFLTKLAENVYQNEYFGSQFTTYELNVQ